MFPDISPRRLRRLTTCAQLTNFILPRIHCTATDQSEQANSTPPVYRLLSTGLSTALTDMFVMLLSVEDFEMFLHLT